MRRVPSPLKMEVEAEDAIVVASEGEESGGGRQRRLRKPSMKARQNGEAQGLLDTVLLSSRKQPGSVSRIATTNGAQNDEMGGDGEARCYRHYRNR